MKIDWRLYSDLIFEFAISVFQWRRMQMSIRGINNWCLSIILQMDIFYTCALVIDSMVNVIGGGHNLMLIHCLWLTLIQSLQLGHFRPLRKSISGEIAEGSRLPLIMFFLIWTHWKVGYMTLYVFDVRRGAPSWILGLLSATRWRSLWTS